MVRTAIAVKAGCLISWRKESRMSLSIKVAVNSSLFAQGLNRIDACRAPGRQKTGSQRSDRDHRKCCSKRQWIVWTYFIKQVAHQTCEHDCPDGANGDA